MENPPERPHADETFAQVIAELKAEYGKAEPAIAERIGVHVSTVNNWANGKAHPRPAAIRALAEAFPKFTEQRLFAAVGRKAPGPLNLDREAKLIEYFRGMTEEQQRDQLIQAKALRDSNQSA